MVERLSAIIDFALYLFKAWCDKYYFGQENEKPIYRGNGLKRMWWGKGVGVGVGQFASLTGSLAKNRGKSFLGLLPQCKVCSESILSGFCSCKGLLCLLQTFFQVMQLGGSYGYHNHRGHKGAFRTKSSILRYDLDVNYFHQKFHVRCFTGF